MRVDTWAGRWNYRPYAKAYTACVEDPFDATDNAGRSVMRATVDFVADEFHDAAEALQSLRNPQGAHLSLSCFNKVQHDLPGAAASLRPLLTC